MISFFLTSDIASATAALKLVNGYLLKGKPVIIQYGKHRSDPSDNNEVVGRHLDMGKFFLNSIAMHFLTKQGRLICGHPNELLCLIQCLSMLMNVSFQRYSIFK